MNGYGPIKKAGHYRNQASTTYLLFYLTLFYLSFSLSELGQD